MRSRPRTLLTESVTRFALVALICALAGCVFDQTGELIPTTEDAGPVDAMLEIDASPGLDDDGDGILNGMDNCVNEPNNDQANNDGDLFGNACDNCPDVVNDNQADTFDGDGIGDVCDDEDSDTVVDAFDNCWMIPNLDQANGDGDSYGDACDNCPMLDSEDQTNSDSDGYGDVCDNCPMVNNQNQANEDNDPIGDACDNCPSVTNDQSDVLDGDGVGDACDPRPNQPGDSILFFDGFADDSAGIPPGYYESAGSGNDSGMWSVSGGKLRQGQSDNSNPTILWRGDIGPGGDGVVDDVLIEMIAEASGVATGLGPYIGSVAAYTDDANTDSGYACAAQATGAGTQVRFLDFQDGNAVTDMAPEFTMTTGTIMELYHYQYGGTDTICQAEDAATDMGRSFTNSYAGGEAMGTIGLMSTRVGASFRHITVYGLGGPLTCPGSALCF